MPVVTVRMDEELVRRVEELAKLQGITRSALIKQSLREAVECRFASHVREATFALRQGRKSGKEIDWTEIEKELQETELQFPTVEKALVYSRISCVRPCDSRRGCEDWYRRSNLAGSEGWGLEYHRSWSCRHRRYPR